MNKTRRKAIAKIYDELQAIMEPLEIILEEEEESFNNIPENLEGSERYQTAEENLDMLQNAFDMFDEALQELENIIHY